MECDTNSLSDGSDWKYDFTTVSQQNLKKIELAIDIIYTIEIMFCFVKRTLSRRDIKQISMHYLKSYFIFDVIATIPNMIFFNEGPHFYFLKVFRFVHVYRLPIPLQLFMKCIMQKYSKKRQNDLTSFAILILVVIYMNHISACIWLKLGSLQNCKGEPEDSPCINSWIYANNFENKSIQTKYIFAIYWIFEVVTTVGYGDYTGKTSEEYVFSIILEFLGLSFFSFLMGSINTIFNTKDNFNDLIESKLNSLDIWIKMLEKSNCKLHIQPNLYNDIRKYVENAFMYDFNLVIEEFQFYQQITPKMQTELIQSTRTFKEFEKTFSHFFEECERGFTNDLIIHMLCRFYMHDMSVISYKTNVKEMYFIKQGYIQVFNNQKDDPRQVYNGRDYYKNTVTNDLQDIDAQPKTRNINKNKNALEPVLYLPKYSYFGDF